MLFPSTDKLEKSDLKCDLMNDEKSYLIPEAKIEYLPPKSRKSHIFSWTILVLLLLTAALWLTPTFNYNTYITTTGTFDPTILPNTAKKVEEAKSVINKVVDTISLISKDNTEMALQYVGAIQEMLQDRTRMATLKINQIVTERIREIESELTTFDYTITDASNGIVEYAFQDLKSIHETISSTTDATYRTDFENVFQTIYKKLADAFADLNAMYTFYGNYMGDIIEHKINNSTERISKIVVSNRKYCECTIKEKLNFCFNISTQNVKVSKQLESVVKVIGILNNTTFMLDTLEPILLTSDDKNACNLFTESRTVLNQALVDAESLMDAILKNDDCFLGSAVRKIAYRKYEPMRQLTLNTFEASIQSLATDLDTTTSSFQIVKEKHRNKIVQDVTNALTALANEIRSKAKNLPASALDEYEEKLSFADMQTYMDTKFKNFTDVMNPAFEKRQKEIAEGLKYKLEFITFKQLPFVSTLSVNNYLPSDVCPLSTDYQKFIDITLNQSLDPMEEHIVKQLSMSSYAFAKENNDSEDSMQDAEDDETVNYKNQIQVDQNTVSTELPDFANSQIEIIDLTEDENEDKNIVNSQTQGDQNMPPLEFPDIGNSLIKIVDLSEDSQDQGDGNTAPNGLQDDHANPEVEVLGSFIEDILNGDSDSSDSQQPNSDNQIVGYEVSA